MLILPLHQPITRANFPLVTAVLILINVVVFLFLQSGDDAAAAAADRYYHGSGLARIELPLAEQHYREHPDPRLERVLAEVPAEVHSQVRSQWQQQDEVFRQRLQAGELFADAAAHQQWQPLASEFERKRAALVTERYGLHAAQPTPLTLFSAMFLHGGLDHLFGNMLFLLALGLLVEGAVGGWVFAALYLIGGLAANAAWLAFHDRNMVIGASGAVAALMGAFCVLWGTRKVRFFYWLVVIFDYVKAPALALLPAWLGWELLQWRLADGDPVAYEAHAGGIVAGALLALGVRQLNWQRDAFFEEAATAAPKQDEAEAAKLIGQMRLAEADRLLESLAQQQPGRLDIALLRHRSARLAGKAALADRLASAALALPARRPDQLREQWGLLSEVQRAGGAVSSLLKLDLLQRLIGSEEYSNAFALARQIEVDEHTREALPALLLGLALRLQESKQDGSAKELLQQLKRQFPDSAQAGKAAFLLGESAQAGPPKP